MKKADSVFKFQKKNLRSIFFIAGPCVIESKELCLKVASNLAALSQKREVDIIFKASYDKANRTSIDSFRGPGRQEGLKILDLVKQKTGLPVLTDIHEPSQVDEVSQVVDVLQIPAFLCRQTDLLNEAGLSGKTVNIKKGQFMSPDEMRYALNKAGKNTWITERGTFFGYNRLVVDYAGIAVLKSLNVPVVFDATHSVQMPGAGRGCSLGNRDLVFPLAKAAIATGVDGLFFEVHPDPQKALCDGPNSLYLSDFKKKLPVLIEIFNFLKNR